MQHVYHAQILRESITEILNSEVLEQIAKGQIMPFAEYRNSLINKNPSWWSLFLGEKEKGTFIRKSLAKMQKDAFINRLAFLIKMQIDLENSNIVILSSEDVFRLSGQSWFIDELLVSKETLRKASVTLPLHEVE